MKSTKKQAQPRPQPQSGPSEVAVINMEFEHMAKTHFPDAYAEPEDCLILKAVFMAGVRQGAGLVWHNAAEPLARAADLEFNKCVGQASAAQQPVGFKPPDIIVQ